MFFFSLLAVPEPVAFYPLNARYKAAEKENRQRKGTLRDVAITNGPYNEPGGAYMFYGTASSYIEFPNNGGLGAVSRKPRILFGPVKPSQNLEPCEYRAVLFTYSKDEGRFPSYKKFRAYTLHRF